MYYNNLYVKTTYGKTVLPRNITFLSLNRLRKWHVTMLVLSGYACDKCPEAISNPCVGRVVEWQTGGEGWQVQ